MKDNLENNKTDLIVFGAKSVLGMIPVAGSFLSELVGSLIPNQRLDRLTKYTKELEIKITKIPIERINNLIENEEFIDLIEEGFIQASRAITDERREYIASIISMGITDETIKLYESKYLLKILSELNDIEIIWLRSFLHPTIGGDNEFREKHKNILKPIIAHYGADNETKAKSAIQNSYKEHLERLELIEHRIKVDKSTQIPEFDKITGKPKKSHSIITPLGRILLTHIGLIENKNQK